jgi:hypothetical protein
MSDSEHLRDIFARIRGKAYYTALLKTMNRYTGPLTPELGDIIVEEATALIDKWERKGVFKDNITVSVSKESGPKHIDISIGISNITIPTDR